VVCFGTIKRRATFRRFQLDPKASLFFHPWFDV
jgi:hypothetical protein